jgi:PAS domain S-box-containing protein
MARTKTISRPTVLLWILPPVFFFVSTLLVHLVHHLVTGIGFPAWPSFLLIDLAFSLCLGFPVSAVLTRQVSPLMQWLDQVRARIREQDPSLQGMEIPADPLAALSRIVPELDRRAWERVQLLSSQRKELERLFDVVPCYITVQDRDFRILRANQMFRQDFGVVANRRCYEVYKDRSQPCPTCSVAQTFQDGQIHSQEEEVILRNGETVSMIVYSAPIRDESGNILAVMEMSTNVSEIKRLQQQLRKQQQQFEQLFNVVPCYISIQDREFNVLQSNEMFKTAFGTGQGKTCYRIYKGAQEPCSNCPVEKTFQDGQVHSSEEIVITAGNREANVIVYASPVKDEGGDVVAVMEMSTDITEVKNLQRELIMMGQSVATMAHSIKNILMGLEGGVFVVTTALEEKNDALLQQGWDMVNRNVGKVSHIVKGLLYCSKQRTPQFRRVDPNQIARETFELFRERAREDEVDLGLDLAESMPDADLDPDSMHDLLANLLSNAVDACKYDQSKPSHWTRLRTAASGLDRILFEVADNGPGIPQELRQRIFDGFFSTKGNKGTGLGLQIARKIVQEHNGTMEVFTEPDQGTTFRITLPVRQPEPDEHPFAFGS